MNTNPSRPIEAVPLNDLQYIGGGYFRDKTIPINTKAAIIHAPELLERMKNQNDLLINSLIQIIQSAVHPDKAVRVMALDLKPIRKTLRECGIIAPELGIDK